MIPRRGRALAGVVAVVGVALAWSAPGCKKDQKSLIVVQVQGRDANVPNLTDVTITVTQNGGFVAQGIFDLPADGLPITPDSLDYGVYVGATGLLTVTAVARQAQGCDGYRGTKMVNVLGGDSPKVAVVMMRGDTCNVMGTAGTTGAAGAGFGGSGGGGGSTSACGTTVGASPATVPSPSLVSCVDLDQNDPGVVCDPVADTNNEIIYSLAASPDGQLLVTTGWSFYSDDVTLKIWRVQSGTPVPCGPLFTASGIGPAYVAFSPDGKVLAAALRHGYVDLFSVPSFASMGEIQSAPGDIWGVGFSPDSQTVFTLDYDGGTDGNLYADRLDGTPITSRVLGVDPDALAISPVANNGVVTLAVAGYIGNVGVYAFNGTTFTTTSIMTTSATSSAAAWGIAFSPDGKLLAAGTDDGVVRFWAAPFTSNATSGTPLTLDAAYTPHGISFAPGGTDMAVTFGPEVDIWNATTRQFVSRHNTVPIPGVSSPPWGVTVSFSASGGALITGEDTCGKIAYCTN